MNAYEQGFTDKCAAAKVDKDQLLRFAGLVPNVKQAVGVEPIVEAGEGMAGVWHKFKAGLTATGEAVHSFGKDLTGSKVRDIEREMQGKPEDKHLLEPTLDRATDARAAARLRLVGAGGVGGVAATSHHQYKQQHNQRRQAEQDKQHPFKALARNGFGIGK